MTGGKTKKIERQPELFGGGGVLPWRDLTGLRGLSGLITDNVSDNVSDNVFSNVFNNVY